MKLGIANQETWIFLQDIHQYLAGQYPTQVFKPARWPLPIMRPKMSHYLLRRSLNHFIHSCDAVLFEWASELLVEASDLKTPSAAALVVRLHRYEMFKWTQRINWDAVSYAILDTLAMRSKLLERTTLSPERALVIPPIGLPQDKFDLSARPFRGNIGILATLEPRKRIYELIIAFAALLKHEPDLHLHIGGNPRPRHQDYYEALLHLVKRLNLTDRVTFYGRVEERWAWYRMIDVFVSFSYSEGMQVSPLEAAANGCYCLSHWWEGADEIFPTEQLFVAEQEFIHKVLAYCCATDDQRQAMRQPLEAFVTQHSSLHQVAADIQTVLERAVAA